MSRFKIGVISDSFRKPFYENIRLSKQVGAQGIQMYAVNGELTPENMIGEKRAELKQFIESNGVEITALCGDVGGFGADAADNSDKVERSKAIMDLALDLGCSIITTHIGVIPEDIESDTYKGMQQACRMLAQYADERNAHFAVETGPEKATVLKAFLDSLDSRGVAVNLDPANLEMVAGDDAVQAVYTLRDYIVHTHAKDGIMLRQTEPIKIYGGDPNIQADDYFKEVLLGQGSVNFPAYLNALEDIGYAGYLTIEREAGDDPYHDISQAVQFLQDLI